jgi:hypothetical protein
MGEWWLGVTVCKSRASEAASMGEHRYFLGMKSRPNRREKKLQSVSYQSQTSA